MCYASPAMLRGCCSCAFGERVTSDRRPAIRGQEERRSLSGLLWLATRHCSANSFVSPTSRKIARKCFVSPTYAKTGGWRSSHQMASPITLLFSSAVLTCKLSTNVGAPTFSSGREPGMLHVQHSPCARRLFVVRDADEAWQGHAGAERRVHGRIADLDGVSAAIGLPVLGGDIVEGEGAGIE
jgi:hypothetical protein